MFGERSGSMAMLSEMKTPLKLVHVGLYTKDEAERQKAMRVLSLFSGLPVKPHAPGVDFLGTTFEMMGQGIGTVGHLAFGTTDVDAAKAELEAKGFTFNAATATYHEDGRLTLIYANETVLGFGMHLVYADL